VDYDVHEGEIHENEAVTGGSDVETGETDVFIIFIAPCVVVVFPFLLSNVIVSSDAPLSLVLSLTR
jgi:hypothetical protein